MVDEFIERARGGVKDVMERHGVGGAAAALLIDGEPVLVEGFGDTGTATPTPIGRETVFSIQSTSKHMCATAVMLGVQRGLLDLDRPLADYLPDFQFQSRLEPEPIRAMSLRILLSHRAGFTHEAPVGNNFNTASPGFAAHVHSIQDTWLRYPVGQRYSYSNLGIDLAGHVLERVSGLSYEACLRAWLFDPIGMPGTTSSADVYAAKADRAIGHQLGLPEVPVRVPMVPSGGHYSNVDDLVRYAQFHLGRGRVGSTQLLDEALWREMHAFRYGSSYALGVARVERQQRDRDVVLFTHNGGGFGFGCCFYYVPDEALAWIVLDNGATKGPLGPLFDPVMPGPILKARYGPRAAPREDPRPAKALEPGLLQSRVGVWFHRNGRCEASLDAGQLCLQFGDQFGGSEPGLNRLDFVADDEARVVDGPAKGAAIRFHAAGEMQAPHFEMPDGAHWDFIDGPSVAPGPVGSEYDAWLGEYVVCMLDQPVFTFELSRKNGYLYFGERRFTPFAPGLLYSGDGETLDLTGDAATFASIQLTRKT